MPKIDTTYAELRDDDVLIAKDGARWHVSGVKQHAGSGVTIPVGAAAVNFWLGDARTKVRAHHMTKSAGDPVTVERIATHADDVARLEAGSALPDPSLRPLPTGAGGTTTTTKSTSTPTTTAAGGTERDPGASLPTSSPPAPAEGTSRPLPGVASPEENARRKALLDATFNRDGQDGSVALAQLDHVAGVAAAAAGLGGTVVVEATADEVDAIRRATEDEPVVLPTFESMTDLEQTSHLFMLHGVFADDVLERAERSKLHTNAHVGRVAGKLLSRHTPHVHSEEATK